MIAINFQIGKVAMALENEIKTFADKLKTARILSGS